ncbi:uncharacterized protein AKAW2_50700S [Aspergillus luchuensis]|uniref:Similar to An13g02610 n=1 Tax=Aspergillus kawachii TaxID=1069201 RepID=A0A146G1H1_ASPKA|nr:uncharacterized protein AKAW2_50700S [Aspergillus luchuensis]BCS00359.1 hypothetical protein AKAW2_50700S [Aspergillus luchuensis]BCS12140.1 hypothetical protein ALUC_50186S [Aspergillus luchuensis]GAA91962.1 similar to An13g02610 [Aspergillus luchuensis IFO 4308]GAT31347.1 similar to An13g02610 [Aspergillus luchuensis]
MDQPTHIIDHEGEVIIVLRNANSPFAPDDYEDMNTEADALELPETDGEQPAGQTDEKRLAKEQPPETPAEDAPLSETPEENRFRIRVSAKHLMFASPVFRNMLTGGWKESMTYLSKGSVEITAESWDIEALLILLRAIHGQQSEIPRKLSLEMLAKVAVLINYYDCKDAVSILTDLWINALEEKVPESGSRDLMLWVWVSQFFKLSSQFETSTSNAMSQCDGLITSRGLPIPEKVISKDTQR